LLFKVVVDQRGKSYKNNTENEDKNKGKFGSDGPGLDSGKFLKHGFSA